ncbi:glycosyltransferase family 4 protein [Luteolibacter sp. GHJ8]|uniref:Glycosyltransferase family 4 protein n=1 Tax=Luteolibacter rhizosphaerae TaxID=2989719 RepID=A0ABT3G0S8_9BACT|nr:glycosyltransferase family 4 protein [Luteolibacter rhizosphaerae]MCW1913438.1 glycosyltransferase family 4 protein [Luteolibacter rhizosphaerae]
MNDRAEGYDYPTRVRFVIDQNDPESYTRAAEFLHINNVEVVSLQHEFGIYGGPAGAHLLGFLDQLKKPVVTTLHTVLKEPDPAQRHVMERLDQLSRRFIVMAERGLRLLVETYGIERDKIDLIPHGVIDMPFVDSNFYKDIFNAEGKTVLLTFGLLSPNKGIESAIEALPGILVENPDVVYLVVGATHPHLIASQGEAYREGLQALARQLGVQDQVVFHDCFVSMEELKEFIGGADIYITPYRNEEQITSGTLAYTFGAGKAIISTPYWHALELLAEERGVLVPFADPGAIATAVNDLLKHPTRMTAMRKKAWKEGRKMTWPHVARRYMESFDLARAGLSAMSSSAMEERESTRERYAVPPAKLDHLFRMTDHTGIFQHAIYNVPNYHEAYCTDDNARAFIFTILHQEEHGADTRIDALASTYLAFLWYAFDANTRRFRNFMNHERQWLESKGSEDSHARALWAAGTALGRSANEGYRNLCALLFQRGLPAVKHFSSPRAWAFTLVAIHEYLRAFTGDREVARMQDILVARLIDLFHANSGPGWRWFERIATYDNAKLPHALIISGKAPAVEIGLSSLAWLIEQQTGDGGQFSPIGCHGFWPREGEKARFDQQPVEAHAIISACTAAYEVTGDVAWSGHALRCFEWFLGRNDLGLPLYDESSGGCRDALLRDHINQNQGAESTLAFHLSRIDLSRQHRISAALS